MNKSIALAAAAVAAVGTVFAGAATASAAGAPVAGAPRSAPAKAAPAKVVVPATYNNACGTGYSVIDTLTLTGGHIYLTYNASNGYNCAATVRNSTGAAVFMGVWIERSDGSGYDSDYDFYTTYAGPVYVHAAGSCIDWGGDLGTSSDFRDGVHCG